jgi:predicted unusual protein kinase regulating ubiquinone biosynthesis (AarF/ABC1/UbiB family)
VLKACHKRCALRTLKVLEQSGGIFIKLGQHLVGAPCGPSTEVLADKP